MTYHDFTARIAAKTDLSQAQATSFCNIVLGNIIAAAESDGKITLPNLGTFSVRSTAARQGRNPKTGEAIEIPASRRISWSPAAGLKKRIKQG